MRAVVGAFRAGLAPRAGGVAVRPAVALAMVAKPLVVPATVGGVRGLAAAAAAAAMKPHMNIGTIGCVCRFASRRGKGTDTRP